MKLEVLGGLLEVLESSWVQYGGGPSWRLYGGTWEHLGSKLGGLGGIVAGHGQKPEMFMVSGAYKTPLSWSQDCSKDPEAWSQDGPRIPNLELRWPRAPV